MVSTVQDICDYLESFAPSRLAEDWDNVGLLVGNPAHSARRVMTCLTVTPASAREAVERGADLIVTHHPLPFHALKRLTTDTVPGQLLLALIEAKIAVYSPHTAFDSARQGINRSLAEGIGLSEIEPLEPIRGDPDALGAGRVGILSTPASLQQIATTLKSFLRIDDLQRVGPADQPVSRVAVACGAAGTFLGAARRGGCDLLVTGETTFHTCLEAEATNVALLLPGHYASERFALERLAEDLGRRFPVVDVWPSVEESDPLQWA